MSEPESLVKGYKDPVHEWEVEVRLKVPSWAPEYMQFSVMLYKCNNCQAYMTDMGGSDVTEFYVTPACAGE